MIGEGIDTFVGALVAGLVIARMVPVKAGEKGEKRFSRPHGHARRAME